MIPPQAFDEQLANAFIEEVEKKISWMDYRQGDTGQPYLEDYLAWLPRHYKTRIEEHLQAREFAAADRLARYLKFHAPKCGDSIPADLRRRIAQSALGYADELQAGGDSSAAKFVKERVVIEWSCASCEAPFEAAAHDAGKRAMCRKCNTVSNVPSSNVATISCAGALPEARVNVVVGKQADCPNGHLFVTEPHYAGAMRKCPTCGEKTLVPKDETNEDMIPVQCPAGHAFEVPSNYAGTRRKCPTCGKATVVRPAAAIVANGRQVTCPNGHPFVTESHYQGTFRRCPTCHQKTLVPREAGPDMIPVRCPDGHSYEVPASYAGTYRRCPDCSQKTIVP